MTALVVTLGLALALAAVLSGASAARDLTPDAQHRSRRVAGPLRHVTRADFTSDTGWRRWRRTRHLRYAWTAYVVVVSGWWLLG